MKLISRITALLMAGAVVCSTLPANAWAVEATDTEGLCEHHPEHTAECGYAPAEPGQPCTFVCEICNSQEGGEPADKPQPDEDECVCTELCTEDQVNADCPVCSAESADLNACKGQPVQEEAECICEVPCMEDQINADCPVCGAEGADLAACKGEPAQEETKCICAVPCTEGAINKECPVCGSENADLTKCEGKEVGEQVKAVQAQIDALPSLEDIQAMSPEDQQKAHEKVQAAYDAYNALTDEQKAQITGAEIFESLFAFFNGLTNTIETLNNVKYLDENGEEQTADNVAVIDNQTAEWSGGWYVVNSDVEISDRITVTGDVHLILADGNTLTAKSGIGVDGEGNSLTIYGQTGGTGKLIATGGSGQAGIGGAENGTITIKGGTVTATGGSEAAGIGGNSNGTAKKIIINGGNITAKGGSGRWGGGAGIGSGYYSRKDIGDIIINGGTVTATGGTNSAGIGNGYAGSVCTFSTGPDGNAFIIASSILLDQTDKNNWSGVIFEGNAGQVYGSPSLKMEAAIPEGKTLIVPKENTLTIDNSVTLTNNGTIDIYGTIYGKLTNNADGTVINHGTIDGSLDNSGTITNQADAAISNKVTNNGTISTYGTISGTLTNNGTIMVGPDGSIPSNSGGSVIPFPDGETYLDASGTPQNIPANAKFLLPGATTLDGWYVVCGKVTLTNRPTVTGEAHLILVDGCELNANSGINVGEGANLTIYAQSNGSNMGKLTALGNFNQAGIGGDAGESGGTITINGGTIAARNDNNGAAGIGGGNEGAGGAITINGGTITASGGGGAAGIGGGLFGAGGTITINGGTVTAIGESGAGIGSGSFGSGGTITINGGTITATYTVLSSGIGAGSGGSNVTLEVHGNAFIIASSISAQTDKDTWSGVIFEGSAGQVYGNPILETDAEIPGDKTLTILQDRTLTIGNGVTLTNNGSVDNHGTIQKNGMIINNGTIKNYGTVQGNGAVEGNPILYQSGTVVTFWKENSQVTEASYGDTITIVATMTQKAQSRAAGAKQVEFSVDGTVFATVDVENENGQIVAKTQVTLTGDRWTASGSAYEIMADFGGNDNLMAGTGIGQLKVMPINVQNATVELSQTTFIYDGTAKTPDVIVKLGKATLTAGTDYEVDYKDNTNAGQATVTVTGKKNYTGSKTVSFTIAQSATEFDGGVTVDKQDKTYTYGDTITVTVTPKATGVAPANNALVLAAPTAGQMAIYEGDRQLTEAKDVTSGSELTFTIDTAEVNLGRGKHTLTAKFVESDNMAAQTGTVEVTVNLASISEAKVTVSGGPFTYDGKPKTPTVTVELNGKPLSGGTDYKLSYENSNGGADNLTNAGMVTVTATGKGNYTGTKTATFTIAQSATEFDGGVTVDKKDKTYTYGDTITVTVTPKATGEAPANNALALAAPTAGQMAIYEGDRQLTEAKDVTSGSELTFTIDTAEVNLGSGKHTLTAKFVESDNMAAQTGTVEVTVSYKITLTGQADSPTKITLNEAVVEPGDTGATITYGYNTLNEAPDNWQTGREFSGLAANTTYYFFAKAEDSSNYAKTISQGVAITTPEKAVSRIEITAQPANLSYTSGQTLDFSDLSVQVYYNDDTNETLTWASGKLTAAPAQGTVLTVAEHNGKTVTISYGGKTAQTVVLTVGKAAQEALFITGAPSPIYEGSNFTLQTSGGSGTGAVTWSVVSGPATVDANGSVTVTGTGDFHIKAVKAADVEYNQAETVITLTATKKPSGGGHSTPTYRPDVEKPAHGEVSVTPKNPEKGDKVTIQPTPDEGYEVDHVTVTDKNGKPVEVEQNKDETWSFKQPSGKVTVKVAFKPIETKWRNPFLDVSEGDWFYDAVRYVYEKGLMAGTSENTFGPNVITNRGMIVTILYRLAGSPDIEDENWGYPYVDVDANAYYGTAVYWARLNGIASGYSDERFGPDDAITREQLAVMLYRFAKAQGHDVTAQADLSGYTDADQISGFAREAMSWASAEGLINGTSGSTLSPDSSATRAQVAVILMRFASIITE